MAYEMRISDWSSYVCSSDLAAEVPPGGESFATLSGRVAAAIETLTRQHAGRDIVCIGHGGTIRAALAHALAVPPEQALSFAIDTCSLTRLDHFADDAQSTPPEERPSGYWRITVDRKSVVEGKSVAVRVDPGGAGNI